MAILFSAVRVMAGEDEVELFAGGIPRELDDLEGYQAVEDLLMDQTDDVEVQVDVSAYLYGEGETVPATNADLQFVREQLKENDRFILENCDQIEDVRFCSMWMPQELFGMEME